MRGRRPKPTKLKLMAGNPGKRPLNSAEPRPKTVKLRCPDWLDEEAKKKWKVLAPELGRLGLLTMIDQDALATYCQAWAEFRTATETIQKEGRTVRCMVDDEMVRVKPHPAVAQQRTAWKAIKDFASLFGMDPSSRSRLKVKDSDPKRDELEAFLEGA